MRPFKIHLRSGRVLEAVEVEPLAGWLKATTTRTRVEIDVDATVGYRVPIGQRHHLIPATEILDVVRDELAEDA